MRLQGTCPPKNLEGDVSVTIPEWNKILIDLFTSGYICNIKTTQE
jgi:hypothetical protein